MWAPPFWFFNSRTRVRIPLGTSPFFLHLRCVFLERTRERYVDGSHKTVFRGVLHGLVSAWGLVWVARAWVVGGESLQAITVFHAMKLSSHVVSALLHLAPFRAVWQMRAVARLDALLIHLSIIGSSAVSSDSTRRAAIVSGSAHGGVVALSCCFAGLHCHRARISLCIVHSALSIVEIGTICGCTYRLLAAGACYLLGAACYVASLTPAEAARHRGRTRYWGYHEDFHAFIFAGDVLSFYLLTACTDAAPASIAY